MQRKEWWMSRYDFNLEDFVWESLQYPEGYTGGEFASQSEKNGQRKTDAGFLRIYQDLLKKLIEPNHNAHRQHSSGRMFFTPHLPENCG